MKHLTTLAAAILVAALSLAAPAALAAEETRIVNINDAEASQIALLPRVGPALAARIVAFREENGKFEEAADLMLVSGIGEKTFALMEPHVAVSGETTLTEKLRVSQVRSEEDSDGNGSD